MKAEELEEQIATAMVTVKEMGIDTSSIANMPAMMDLKYYFQYNYQTIAVNRPLPDDLFGSAPVSPPNVRPWGSG